MVRRRSAPPSLKWVEPDDQPGSAWRSDDRERTLCRMCQLGSDNSDADVLIAMLKPRRGRRSICAEAEKLGLARHSDWTSASSRSGCASIVTVSALGVESVRLTTSTVVFSRELLLCGSARTIY